MEDSPMKFHKNPIAKSLNHSILAAGLSAALVAPAFAADPIVDDATRPTRQIRVADLDLGTAAGQRKLDARIESAIRKVCRPTSRKTGTRIMGQSVEECKARARAEAKSQVAALRNETQRGG
jgi:UrcA family protein